MIDYVVLNVLLGGGLVIEALGVVALIKYIFGRSN